MIKKTVYVANDGKEFFDKEECLKYEKFLDEVLSNIKYFSIYCSPDLTENGRIYERDSCCRIFRTLFP